MKKIAVTGGGMGGLSAALRLAASGRFKVDVFERSERVGGKAGTLEHDGFCFDTGPTLLTMDFVLRDLFADAGADLESFLSLKKLEANCVYFFPDGSRFSAWSDEERLCEEVDAVMSDPGSTMKEYLSYCNTIYDLTADLFLFSPFQEMNIFREFGKKNPLEYLRGMDPFRTMHRANASFFKDVRLVQFADRYATYNGSNPFKAPATLNIIQHVEQAGVYVPEGGIRQIPAAFEKLCHDHGVNIQTGAEVEQILLKDRRVSGVMVDGEKLDYDAVVSNCDVHRTYERLLGDRWSWGALKYRWMQPSTSAMVFYWGVKGKSDLSTHTILFPEKYAPEFRALFSRKKCPDDPTVYIYISCRFSPDDSPEDHENWYVMINAPADRGQDWKAEIDRMRAAIRKRISTTLGIDIESRTVSEKVFTPPDIEEKTASSRGSLYGPSSNGKFSAFLRQANRSRRYRGLYFCGGSAHPGGGIPLAALSGKHAADLATEHES